MKHAHVIMHRSSHGGNVCVCTLKSVAELGQKCQLYPCYQAPGRQQSGNPISWASACVLCAVCMSEDKNGSSTATSGRLDQDREGEGVSKTRARWRYSGWHPAPSCFQSSLCRRHVTIPCLASRRLRVSLALLDPDFAVQDARRFGGCLLCVHTVIIDCRGTHSMCRRV